MKYTLTAALTLTVLLLTGCPVANNAPPSPGGQAVGMVIGSTFDGAPLTIGKGELEDKALVITYFATW